MMEELLYAEKSNWAKVIHQMSFLSKITQLKKSNSKKQKTKNEKKNNLTLGVFIIEHIHTHSTVGAGRQSFTATHLSIKDESKCLEKKKTNERTRR
jgi:hypothetical protein